MQTGQGFGRGDRGRLERARERGFFDARNAKTPAAWKVFGAWCWRLKLPLIWLERRAPRSRYGRVHLDMLTTPDVLNADGMAALRAIGSQFGVSGPSTLAAHGATWDCIPLGGLEEAARAVLRVAIRSANRKPSLPAAPGASEFWRNTMARIISMPPRQAASA